MKIRALIDQRISAGKLLKLS